MFKHLTQNSSVSATAIKLLSAMLQKAWPPELKDKKLNEKENVILLKHLLTWSIWQGFLKFIGKKTKT